MWTKGSRNGRRRTFRSMAGEVNCSSPGSEGSLGEFLSSMPESYTLAFPRDGEEHAAIVARRGERSAHLELWRTSNEGLSVVCVVADDRPGLLSTICRVFVAHEIDVVSAKIHSRFRQGERPPEAVDFFWLRPRGVESGRTLSDDLVRTLARDLELAVKNADAITLRPGRATPPSPLVPLPPPRVFFNTNALRKGTYALVVEAPDTPGLLLSISLALHMEGIEIAGSDIRTENGMARDSFILEGPTLRPHSPDRLASLRRTVVEAVQRCLLEAQAER
jgi:UTP:GlnB (protein PII) uridylyltransferase